MSTLTIFKVILIITVMGLFFWTFKGDKSNDDETFKYGKYMIYLLVFEVAILVIFSVL